MRSARRTTLLVASLLLAGCASRPASHGALPPREPAPPLPAPLQALFDGHAAGGTPVAASPWGRNVTIMLSEPYPAASGRECRAFTVRSGGQVRPGLACRRPDDAWAEVRVLHHHGRPVMEGST